MTHAFRLAALLCGLPLFASAANLTVQAVDANGKALVDAVIFAEPEAAAPKNLRSLTIEQRALKFMPLVSVIQTGSTVNFPNNDKVRHHIYSFSPAHKFDQKLYSGTAATPQVFDKAGTVVMGCNIHDKMVAYVRVVDTPFFAKTDASGKAQIDLPAAGKYTVKIWHYNQLGSGGADQVLSLKSPTENPATLHFKLAVKPPAADEGGSESSY